MCLETAAFSLVRRDLLCRGYDSSLLAEAEVNGQLLLLDTTGRLCNLHVHRLLAACDMLLAQLSLASLRSR